MIGRSDSSPALAAQGDATVGARRDWPSVDRCVAESDQLALRPRLGDTRPYGVGARLHGLPAGLSGRTLLAGVCLAGERLRLTP